VVKENALFTENTKKEETNPKSMWKELQRKVLQRVLKMV